MSTAEIISSNLEQIRTRITQAALRSGRTADQVRLIAVSKYVDTQVTRLLAEAGALDLGESRPQQLAQKVAELADLPIRWHQIGHLQRNKVRHILPVVSMIHSVDCLSLMTTLEKRAATLSQESAAPAVKILIEINISGDPQKHGFAPSELPEAIAHAQSCHHIQVAGLMAMSGRDSTADEARRQFAELRQLRDASVGRGEHPWQLQELSMGMSRDFETAIEEGATLVRVGSLLTSGFSQAT